MSNETFEKVGKIILVTFSLNLLVLIAALFYYSKNLMIAVLFINIVLLGTALILKKYWILFEGISQTNKFAQKLNKGLKRVENGKISG